MEHSQTGKTSLEVVSVTPIELVRSGANQYLQGYAALYWDGTEATTYRPLPNVEERIKPGAFADVLSRNENIRALYDHNDSEELGCTTTATLFLRSDERGLHFQIPFDPDFPALVNVVKRKERGAIKGCSFRAAGSMSLQKQGNKYVRTIDKIDELVEISLVRNPAYEGTDFILRSIDEFNERERLVAETKKRLNKLH